MGQVPPFSPCTDTHPPPRAAAPLCGVLSALAVSSLPLHRLDGTQNRSCGLRDLLGLIVVVPVS